MIVYSLAGFALIMAASFARKTPDKFTDFCVGAALPIMLVLLLPLGIGTAILRPETMDGSLRHLDLVLGLDGFALTRWLLRTGLYALVSPVYSALPLMMAAAWALERPRTLLRASLIGPVLALPFYLLVPAVGPEYAFAGFPEASGRLANLAGTHPRNCMPSMHLAWAILLALNLRDRRWRWAFIAYAVLMAFATVAGGEHYFADVIAAVPFALAVEWLAENSSNILAAWKQIGRRRVCEILCAED